MPNPSHPSASVLRLPIVFEENVGQAVHDARWIVRTPSGLVLFFDDHVTFNFPVPVVATTSKRVARALAGVELSKWLHSRRRWKSGAIDMHFGASRRPKAAVTLKAAGHLATKDGSVPFKVAASIVYENIAPGIDIRFYDDGGRLRYDIVLAPLADVAKIRLTFGNAIVRTDPDGNLAVLGPEGGLWQSAPRCFSEKKRGTRVALKGGFALGSNGEVGFRVLRRPSAAATTIDPELVFGSYLGVTDETPRPWLSASGVYCDVAYGNGWTASDAPSFPHTIRRYDCTHPESPVLIFVTVVHARRVLGIASTEPFVFLCGATPEGVAISADAADHVEPPHTGFRNFILRLESDGTPSRATYYRFPIHTIAVDPLDPDGGVFVTGFYIGGSSYGVPLRIPREYDTLVTKLDVDLREVLYFTSLGSNEGFGLGRSTHPIGISVANGFLFVAGDTTANDMATPGAFSSGEPPVPCLSQSRRIFVTKLTPTGTVVFSAVLGDGATANRPTGIAGLADGTCVFSGLTGSDPNGGPGNLRRFVCRVASDGSSLDHVRNISHEVSALAVEASGAAWLAGETQLSGLATADAAQRQQAGGWDGFLCRVTPDGGVEDYYTYLGGSADDSISAVARAGNALYAVGTTTSPNLPTAGDAFETTYGGQRDIFLAILVDRAPLVSVTKKYAPEGALIVNQSIVFTMKVKNEGIRPLSGLVLDDVASAGIALLPDPRWQEQAGRVFIEQIDLAPGQAFAVTLDAIVVEADCSENKAIVSQNGVRIAEATVRVCTTAPVAAGPDLLITLSDDSALFATDAGGEVTIIVAIKNRSNEPVPNVTLTHRSLSPSLRFARLRPLSLVIQATTPAATWNNTTGLVAPRVTDYDAHFDIINPGQTVHVFATSTTLKTGSYESEVLVHVPGYPGYGPSVSQSFHVGPVADVRLQLDVTHIPPTPVAEFQSFEITVGRTAADAGQTAPALGLHAEITVPHGTPVPVTLDFGTPPSNTYYSLSLTHNGGYGNAIQVIRESAAGDTWLASFVVREIPDTAIIVLRPEVLVSLVVVRIEGPLETLPTEARWSRP